MPLSTGSRLGPYEVTSVIGAGGMGEVYKARDTKLGRDVAIKVLPQVFLGDPERTARFQREARTLASFNHPNIATIHQLEQAGEVKFLVMELISGQTLAEIISSGSLDLTKALWVASQIAEAFEAAHEKGIIHRDLKPANVMVTTEGRVKVLDFGLAKALTSDDVADFSLAATVSAAPTANGTMLGTPGYMSPEQARGQAVDKRCDVWAFGCLLYELLTAHRAFPGATPPDTIAAVLEKEPDWQALPAATPTKIQDLLRRCLQKDLQRRQRDLGDARIEIEEALSQLREPGASGATGAASNLRSWLPWAVVLLVVAGFSAWIVAYHPRPAFQNPLADARFSRLTDFKGAETDPAISPDGKFVAFVSDRGGAFDIWLVQSNGGSIANLTRGHVGDMRAPVRAIGFSSDGSEVFSGGTQYRRLMLWPLMGGTPHNFLDEHAAEVAWSPDGTRIAYHTWDPGDPTFVADHDGSNPHEILRDDPGLHNHYPIWAIDGRWIYFARGRPATREMDLYRISPDGGKLEQLTHLNSDVAYPTPIDERTVLFVAHNQDGAGPWLWAYDVEERESHRVSSGLEQYTAVAASSDGRRLAASVLDAQTNLWSFPITSGVVEEQRVEPYQLPTVRAQAPRFGGGSLFYLSSPDGADGLWSYRDGQALEIWKGSEGALQSPAAVAPDGKTVAFALRREGRLQMHVMAADGTQLRPLSSDVDVRGTASWSPDGGWIVVAGSDHAGAGLFKLPVNGGAPVRLATGAFLDPVWSPRGDLIVYCGTQVFTVAPLLAMHPDGTPVKLPDIKVQRDGERARFLPSGSGLVYMRGDSISGQDFWLLDLATMQSRRLTHLTSPAATHAFDVTPDGARIVFDRSQEDSNIVLVDLAAKQRAAHSK